MDDPEAPFAYVLVTVIDDDGEYHITADTNLAATPDMAISLLADGIKLLADTEVPWEN